MLRFLALLLLLANGLFYAWSQQMLRPYGFGPTQQTEPYRLAQQIHPQWLQILSADEARRVGLVAQSVPKATQCLQAGPFDEAQTEQLRQSAQTLLPSGSWVLDAVIEPARWIVYMGRYPDAQTLDRKRAELALLNLHVEPVTSPDLVYGLALGGFDTESLARAELAALDRRGVRTAQVLQERVEQRGAMFRMHQVDDTLRVKLDGLKSALADKALRSCD